MYRLHAALRASILFSILLISACGKKEFNQYPAHDPAITYAGRVDKSDTSEVILIGSASSARFFFSGDSCVVSIRNKAFYDLHNYIVVELDGQYLGRVRLEKGSVLHYPIKVSNKNLSVHELGIYKATEAMNGHVSIVGFSAGELVAPPAETPKKSIEFIGNSITCGMGLDLTIPCDTDQWYDQHNGYLAYGPLVSRRLDVNYMLSSVSGIGIYRNWNSNGPTMPQVYQNQYLDTDSTKSWDFSQFAPDVVSIALGTNDFSDGDGINERLAFDSALYISNYEGFIRTIYKHYPNTQVVLLASPMVSGEKGVMFSACLQSVKARFSGKTSKEIQVFEFDNITPHGCGYHPDAADHQLMAEQLYPFYKSLLE